MPSSYRLEAPRPRPPPLPLRTSNLATRSASPSHISGIKDSPQTLLYDLPPAAAMSPTHALPKTGGATPTSPTNRGAPRAARGRGKTPPPNAMGRGLPSSKAAQNDLEQFAGHCRAWYYQQDDNAGRLMTQTLATLPPSQRAPYARLQASIRSAFHASVNARRNAEFQAHIAVTHPGGSLMPHSRADPYGPLAKKERYERLERFVRTWCTMGMPGTRPFFEGLWAVMRLQVVPEHLGGAGMYRIEWEIDDAVFKEAAGKDFMLEAIDVLKGVLAFEEIPSSKRSPSLNGPNKPTPYAPFSPLAPIHSRSQSQPLSSDPPASPLSNRLPPIASRTQTKRPRAPSDPFMDNPPLSTSYSSANTQVSTSGSSTVDEPPSPTTPPAFGEDVFSPTQPSGKGLPEVEEYLRIWIAPDLPNPEYLSLLNVFPAFIGRRALPRFPVELSQRQPDIEEGEEARNQGKQINIGTGTMWLGSKPRMINWQGDWWTRFKMWWKRIFC